MPKPWQTTHIRSADWEIRHDNKLEEVCTYGPPELDVMKEAARETAAELAAVSNRNVVYAYLPVVP